jgi:protein-disulfide isomerase
MCILSYAVNLMLLYFTWIVRKRFECEPILKAIVLDIRYLLSYPKTLVPVTSVFSMGAVLMVLFFPSYWNMTPSVLSKDVPTGITQDGHHWIGAEDPELVIVEFSDYRCFQCKKMHFFLRRIIENNPDKIRLVHRHFPMDHIINPIVNQPFHNGAAKLAIISLFAAEKDKFWEMNDALFEIDRQTETVNIQDLAQKTGIDFEEMKHAFSKQELWIKLHQDIQDGLKYGLTGTPGFVIDEQVYLGQIPPDVLRRFIR